MATYGIAVSADNTDARTVSGQNLLINPKYTFLKTDVSKSTSFQTIDLFIATEPPAPVGPSYAPTYTVLYMFAHGYAYIPSIAALFVVTAAPPGSTGGQSYFYDNGLLGAMNIYVGASMQCFADKDNVYLMLTETSDGSATMTLAGTAMRITLEVYAEDIGV